MCHFIETISYLQTARPVPGEVNVPVCVTVWMPVQCVMEPWAVWRARMDGKDLRVTRTSTNASKTSANNTLPVSTSRATSGATVTRDTLFIRKRNAPVGIVRFALFFKQRHKIHAILSLSHMQTCFPKTSMVNCVLMNVRTPPKVITLSTYMYLITLVIVTQHLYVALGCI